MKAQERDWSAIVVKGVGAMIANTGDWRRGKGFDTGWDNFGEKLMLVVTEVSEAMEAADSVVAHLKTILGGGRDSVLEGATLYREAIVNYTEEWTDVLVRLFDLCEACDLGIEDPEIPDEIEALPSLVGGQFSSRATTRGMMTIRALSNAMEAFRDMSLVRGAQGTMVVGGDYKTIEAKRLLERWLSAAVLVCAHAIEEMGVSWLYEYAEKMEKNEGRPAKHGRQR